MAENSIGRIPQNKSFYTATPNVANDHKIRLERFCRVTYVVPRRSPGEMDLQVICFDSQRLNECFEPRSCFLFDQFMNRN